MSCIAGIVRGVSKRWLRVLSKGERAWRYDRPGSWWLSPAGHEEVVEGLLGEIALGAGTMTRVVGALSGSESTPDRRELDRIERERARATAAYLRDRDTVRLEARMRELDQAAEAARSPKDAGTVPADVAVSYLRDLPATWRAAEGGSGRQLLASALFSRIEVLGLQEATVHLTDHAVRHGIAAALPREVGISVSGRGERDSPSRTQRPDGFLLINRTKPREATSDERSA